VLRSPVVNVKLPFALHAGQRSGIPIASKIFKLLENDSIECLLKAQISAPMHNFRVLISFLDIHFFRFFFRVAIFQKKMATLKKIEKNEFPKQ